MRDILPQASTILLGKGECEFLKIRELTLGSRIVEATVGFFLYSDMVRDVQFYISPTSV
jgi:hypothetical protein